ncbi:MULTISPECIES: carbohydrate ABC transporter permease [Jonquetella]|uniref:ABC-type sugar transport system, permease component n=1 Tax=Jonquetella anthropi DSM 22815 TaxID=885272 RepID=H0UKT5_9BACT|nr:MULTISPECIES: carbohydrate ABC transporter permease [Jonquetella]EHM13294.1 ABC-type sugar transport system, permease component [Jonquetella anthropi DSM 22815]ERL23568.1 ABC transporter, permease protein [Jonquetella sp. BV3C21]
MRRLGLFLMYAVLLLGAFLTLLPFVWMISTSLKTPGEAFAMPPIFIPQVFHWENYLQVAKEIPLWTYLFNSFFVTVCVTAGTLVTTIFAAFGFSRLHFFGRDVLFALCVATMMIPGEALLIPNYVTLSKMGLVNTYTALILPWTASAFCIFLLRQYFLSVPESLYNAARIDGCSNIRFLFQIMVPLARPALVTIGLLRVILSWNEFLWPLIVTDLPQMRTLPVALSVFTNEAGIRYHLLMATATVIILPIIGLYLLFQKNFLRAVDRAGTKG